MAGHLEPRLRYAPTWHGVGALLVLSVIFLSLIPKLPVDLPGIPGIDKIGHFIAYATLMGWYVQILISTRARLISGLFFVAMGIGLEFIQGLGASRFFEWADAAANSIGVVAGFALGRTRFANILQEVERRWFAGQ